MFAIEHENQHPSGWDQIVPYITTKGLIDFEVKFKSFGKAAGFTNSLFEKYVFLNPGVWVAHWQPAQDGQGIQRFILMMSAQPVPISANVRVRFVIYQEESEVRWSSISEEAIQRAFAEAARQIPQPQPQRPLTLKDWGKDRYQPFDKARVLRLMHERGASTLEAYWSVYQPWSGIAVVVVCSAGLSVLVWFLDKRRCL